MCGAIDPSLCKGHLLSAAALYSLGVSGGALAAVFKLYERMISFLSNITADF